LDNGVDYKPNPIKLDEERSKLLEKILLNSSNNTRLDAYLDYFFKILSYNKSNFEEAFLSEFLEDYLNIVRGYEAWGNDPELTQKVFKQLQTIKEKIFAKEYADTISKEITRLESQLNDQANILNGIGEKTGDERKAYFPVIDNEAPFNCYGLIESITVRINKSDSEDKFIIIPSEKEIEHRISEQIKISWKLALIISEKYIRKHNHYHEVIISFDKKAGFYVGNSLGIALTLSFLEQILKFYNPTYIINISEGSAFTGGIDTQGNMLNTGEEIIKRKVAAVFFSQLNFFVIPKLEETYAYFALGQLKKKYPGRKLKLITVEDIDDILNRRDLVEIKKQKAIVRTGKFVKKNLISAIATFFLAFLFAYLFVMDFDDNPSSLDLDGSKVYVKNAKGRVLWSKELLIPKHLINQKSIINKYVKIIDINGDNKNEILFVGNNSNRVKCFDFKQNELWSYKFEDLVENKEQKLNTEYVIMIIDTFTYGGEKSVYLISTNGPSFSSAIYRISAEDGKRLSGTLWAAGHFTDAIIMDYDDDGENEIISVGADNGYEDLAFFICELDTLIKMRPTTNNYLLENITQAQMDYYLRLPKSDYDKYLENRTPHYRVGSFAYNADSKKFVFSTGIDLSQIDLQLGYEITINNGKVDVDVVIGSHFRVIRDSLVAKGKLNLPYTDTEGYKEIIKNNILYWKDGKWVNRKEIENK